MIDLSWSCHRQKNLAKKGVETYSLRNKNFNVKRQKKFHFYELNISIFLQVKFICFDDMKLETRWIVKQEFSRVSLKFNNEI